MYDKLLIKNGTGRVLLDSDLMKVDFVVQPSADKWTIEIMGIDLEKVNELNAVLEELHMFYFERTERLMIIQKYWMYDLDQPQISYDEGSSTLHITVDNKIPYEN